MKAPRRGCLYWAHLDKRRPVLVVSPDYRNERATDVIVVPCSTRLIEGPTHVRLTRGQAGLAAESMLKCEQLTTIHLMDVVSGPMGSPLATQLMAKVERAILRAIGIALPLT